MKSIVFWGLLECDWEGEGIVWVIMWGSAVHP